MSLLDTIVSSQGGAAVEKLAGKFGLSQDQVQQALGQLVPGLSSGVKRNLERPEGLENLLGALNKKNHQRYLDNPDDLDNDDAIDDGKGILGHLLGGKDVSRELAGRASQNTCIDSGILKSMLPMVAQLAMGALGKQAGSTGMLGADAARRAPAQNPLLSLLDADGDGSVVDDLLGLAGKFLRR